VNDGGSFSLLPNGLKDNDFDYKSSDAGEQLKSFSSIAILVDSIWTIFDA
jgi:hypothetical protein